MAGFALRPTVLAVLAVLAAGCSLHMSQSAHTGTDGTAKGAKPIELVNGEGKAHGIVTYPGGDRVDWKSVTTPDKPADRGTLSFHLTWVSPRPGERLKFDVFDQWGHPLVASTREEGESPSRSQQAMLPNAKGTYLVRIYAVNRADAGTYHMTVDWATTPVDTGPPVEIAMPVQLPGIPGVPDPECDPFKFDRNNPKCRDVCPKDGTPVGADWPGCANTCPATPSVDIPACLAVMPCPLGHPDKRITHCKATDWGKCKDLKHPDPTNPNCPTTPPAQTFRITSVSVSPRDPSGRTSEVKVQASEVPEHLADFDRWTVEVVDASGNPLRSGTAKLTHVTGAAGTIYLTATVPLPVDRLANTQLKLTPPPVE